VNRNDGERSEQGYPLQQHLLCGSADVSTSAGFTDIFIFKELDVFCDASLISKDIEDELAFISFSFKKCFAKIL